MSLFGLGRPNLPAPPSRPPGLSTTGGPTSWGTVGRVTWKSVLELAPTVNRTPSAVARELHRDCSSPRAELALMPTVTGKVAATRSARREGRRGQSVGLVRLLECMTAESRTPCLASKTKTNARTRRVPRRVATAIQEIDGLNGQRAARVRR